MAVQLLPILKAVAPYVAQVATAAIPAFTAKSSGKVDPLLATQIEELQGAATQNAEAVHLLAEKLQETLDGIEVAAQKGKREVAVYKTMLVFSLAFSLLSFTACLYLLFGQ